MASASATSLPAWKASFLDSCASAKSLTFGTYTLKSGRISPYFFNAGVFHEASLLQGLSLAFAHTIASHNSPRLEFDVLFGPSYKGIPLATATVLGLASVDGERFKDVGYAFDRKEVKSYGDGGRIVGKPLKGRKVLIIDDVMTAGTAIRESAKIIKEEGGLLVGIVVMLDRMEKMPTATDEDGKPGPSAIGEVRRMFKVPVTAVLTLEDIMEGLKLQGNELDLKRLEDYRARYRCND